MPRKEILPIKNYLENSQFKLKQQIVKNFQKVLE